MKSIHRDIAAAMFVQQYTKEMMAAGRATIRDVAAATNNTNIALQLAPGDIDKAEVNRVAYRMGVLEENLPYLDVGMQRTKEDQIMLDLIEAAASVHYVSDADLSAERTCCNTMTFDPHETDCSVVRAVRHLQETGVHVPQHLIRDMPEEE